MPSHFPVVLLSDSMTQRDVFCPPPIDKGWHLLSSFMPLSYIFIIYYWKKMCWYYQNLVLDPARLLIVQGEKWSHWGLEKKTLSRNWRCHSSASPIYFSFDYITKERFWKAWLINSIITQQKVVGVCANLSVTDQHRV